MKPSSTGNGGEPDNLMHRDATLTLALNLHANPGVYALLLGSGVSTGAGMPTGWGVVQDLIRRLAAARREPPAPDVEAWYRAAFGEEPDYDAVLARVTKTQADRQALLRGYFEPTNEEREAGAKVPTAAHHAIADLARHGYVRLILTTNFDRLLEQALEAAGVRTTMISTPDQLEGAMPLVHASGCTVLKLHGDYMDARIRNTSDELAVYPDAIRAFLSRVFDEFGLIICGWSAEWDVALRDAILSTPGRRFGTYWLQRSASGAQPEVRGEARRIIDHRRAAVIPISGAEQVFPSLQDQLASLRDFDRPDPLSVQVAVATTKRYLAEERHRIRLRDLMYDETERTRSNLSGPDFPADRPNVTAESFQQRLRAFEGILEPLVQMLMAVAYYGRPDQAGVITNALQRLASIEAGNGLVAWIRLQKYPAFFALYATGLCNLASGNLQLLASILSEPRHTDLTGLRLPLLQTFYPQGVFLHDFRQLLPYPDADRRYLPVSDYIADELKPLMSAYVPEELDYVRLFDVFEYLLGLVYWDMEGDSADWAPMGAYMWRRRRYGQSSPLEEFVSATQRLGSESPLLASLFGGSIERFNRVVEAHKEFDARASRQFR